MATCSQAAGGIGSHHASGNLADISSDPVASIIFKRKPSLICAEMVLPRRSLASMMHDSDKNCIVMYCIAFIYPQLHKYVNIHVWRSITVDVLLTFDQGSCTYNLNVPLFIGLPLLKRPHLAFGVLLGSLWHTGILRMSLGSRNIDGILFWVFANSRDSTWLIVLS